MIDLRIVLELLHDSRVPFTALAKRCGLSRKALCNRIQKLLLSGIIEGFTVSVNLERLGLENHAFLLLRIKAPQTLRKVEQLIRLDRRVARAYQLLSENTLLLEVFTLSKQDLNDLIDNFCRLDLPAYPQILPVSKTIKEMLSHPVEYLFEKIRRDSPKNTDHTFVQSMHLWAD